MVIKKISILELRDQYYKILPVVNAFSNELVRILQKMVDDLGITLGYPIQARVKTWRSISEKLDRVAMNIEEITDLQDLIGVRTIFLYSSEAERFCGSIESAFIILKREDTRSRLGIDQFGYSSVHLIIKLPPGWSAVPTLSSFTGLKAELQVRTMAQHLWSEASHRLQYKTEASVPEPLRRTMFRLSASLEGVDNELERILAEKAKYLEQIQSNNDRSLNIETLRLTMRNRLPSENKAEYEDHEEILLYLKLLDITTTRQLERILDRHLPTVLKMDRDEVKRCRNGPDVLDYDDLDRVVRLGVYFTHQALIFLCLEQEFGSGWRERISDALVDISIK